ncbi:MAG: flagellar biosynthesis anti-sigma factor FlgM [Desulfovibrio sp.]|nr:flagellar biosynthesis anti-sigma factor FlgM [Desulfovibrio sp.]
MEIKNALLTKTDPYGVSLDKARATSPARRGTQADAAEVRARGDVVSFSPEAALRTEAYRAANAAPEIRREKVEEIKARLASGGYAPDSRSIARKLLESEAYLAGTLGR